jgi:hypothetical protein
MNAEELVIKLIESDVPRCARRLIEASETGRQVSRATGLTDRQIALALAKEWESRAQRKRAAKGAYPGKASIHVRPGSPEKELGCLTQKEIAVILRLSERGVREIERRAIDKLRRHPSLRAFWRRWLAGEIDESLVPQSGLTPEEIRALFGLTRNALERQALWKLLVVVVPT